MARAGSSGSMCGISRFVFKRYFWIETTDLLWFRVEHGPREHGRTDCWGYVWMILKIYGGYGRMNKSHTGRKHIGVVLGEFLWFLTYIVNQGWSWFATWLHMDPYGLQSVDHSGFRLPSFSGSKIYWLVVWNMILIFPYIGNNHPNWLIFFQRGRVKTTKQICSHQNLTNLGAEKQLLLMLCTSSFWGHIRAGILDVATVFLYVSLYESNWKRCNILLQSSQKNGRLKILSSKNASGNYIFTTVLQLFVLLSHGTTCHIPL